MEGKMRIRRYRHRRGTLKSQLKIEIFKLELIKFVCCLLKADKEAGSPLLRGLAQKLTGINLEAPKRIITARRTQ